MNMIRTKTPSETQKNNLLLLQETCRDHDCINLTFPVEEDCIYYLLYDEDNLLSALCAFFNENGDYECSAYTRPSKRKQGHFTLLLDELLKETGDIDLIFPVEEACTDTVRTLEAIGASFWYQEHIMEVDSSAFFKSGLVENAGAPEALAIKADTKMAKGPVPYIFLMNGRPIGSCYMDSRGHSTYFHGFEIKKELRGRGLGQACLSLLLETFFKQPATDRPEKLFLQVSGLNQPAMALYKKAGFRIRESLSYYVY